MLTALRGLAALVLVFVMCAAAQADVRDEFEPSGKIWTVDKDGGGDFETISAAIEAAADGDGIRVLPGVYRESLSIKKEIYIESADGDRDDVVIETENNPCVYFAAERGAVRGMTLRNSGYQRHACVHIVSGELLLADNDVSSKISDGVRIWGGDSNPAVIGNRIYENEFHGVYAQAAAKGRFENNEIYNNTFSGAYVEGAADLVFIGNRIHGNKKAGIYMTGGAKGRFENNEIFGNTNDSVQVTRGADPLFTGNRIFDGKSGGVSVYENGKGRFKNNEIYDNTFAGVIVEDAEPVFTDNRIYGNKENGVWMFAAAKGRFENNEIYGNTFSGVSVKERAEPVFTGNRVYDNKDFGILVSAAKGRFENNEIYKNNISGVYVAARAEPMFIGNRIHGNKGVGLHITEGAKGRFENNEIYGNTNNNVDVTEGADPLLTGNRIFDGKAGGVVVEKSGKGRFENNETHGHVANVIVGTGSDPVFTGNRIYGGELSAENAEFARSLAPQVGMSFEQAGVIIGPGGKGRFENNEIDSALTVNIAVSGGPGLVTDPAFAGNRISGGRWGVIIINGAGGRFENNDISGAAEIGVVVEDSDPVFAGNRIYGAKEGNGVMVQKNARGRFEDNEIYGNKFSGVYVTERADPVFINNRVYDNKEHGIAVIKGGKGRYENNEISGNKKEQFIGPKESGPLPPETAAIGMLEARPASGNGRACTAFLTGPDTVVTAAHCVKSYSGDLYELSDVKFHDLSENGLPPVSAAEYLHVGDYTSYASRTNTFRGFMAPMGKDIAVVRISEPLGDKLGWLRKGKVDWDEIADGGEYQLIGAPEGYLIREKSCKLHSDVTRMWEGIYSSVHEAFETGAFFHTCATRSGYSGGPILREDNGELTWIGVTSSTIVIRWPGYPPAEDVGTAMILQPGGDLTAGE